MTPLTLPPGLSSFEVALAVGFARLGGGSDGSWRGAFGIAQRQIPARAAGHGERGQEFSIRAASAVVRGCNRSASIQARRGLGPVT
jgi:hypothetical protein